MKNLVLSLIFISVSKGTMEENSQKEFSPKVRFGRSCPLLERNTLKKSINLLSIRLNKMIEESSCYNPGTLDENQSKRLKVYRRKINNIRKLLDSTRGIKIECFKRSDKKSKTNGLTSSIQAYALLCGRFYGINTIHFNIHEDSNSLDHKDPMLNMGIIIHELSHLFCTRDIAWFVNKGRVPKYFNGPMEYVDWEKNADTYNYFVYNKFKVLDISCDSRANKP